MTLPSPQPPQPPSPPSPDTGFILPPKWYDRIRVLVQVILPALSTLYFTLGGIWGLPAVTQVVGTLAALVTFGGVGMTLSRKNYMASDAKFDGNVVGTAKPGGGIMYTLELEGDPNDIEFKKELHFKVVPPGS